MSRTTRVRRYVHSFIDNRHGKARARFYFRRKGFRQVPLPGIPGSPEFEQAYAAALLGVSPLLQTTTMASAKRPRAGSLDAIVIAWFNSASFLVLSPSTRKSYRRILESFTKEHGDKPIALLTRKHVEAIFLGKKTKPAAANNWLAVVKKLMRFAVSEELVQDNIASDIESIKRKSEGFHTWSEAEIEQFEAHHAIGTKERLAFALALYTAQRRSDIVKLGSQHIRGGILRLTQQKTRMRLSIPVHPELQHIIAATPHGHLTFLTTKDGAPYTIGGFGTFFRQACRAAGLAKHCAAHGLRKAACRRLAEAGCSVNQIAAISGHKTLAEVQRYTAAADRERMAGQAMAAMIKGKPREPNRNASGNGD